MDEIRLHFDRLAKLWDTITMHPPARINHVLSYLGDIRGKSIIDAGSGTGILLPYLLQRTGATGRVIALDISSCMIEVSRGKHSAANLAFATGDFLSWVPPFMVDLIIAYSCFPHFREPASFWQVSTSKLMPGGMVLVAHIEGRDAINKLHEGSAKAVSRTLVPVDELADLAEGCGFETVAMEDNDEYFVLLTKLRV